MNATYRFGPFVYDGAADLLRRDGTTVPLKPKQLELLRFLLSRAGEVVTKDTLFDAVWPATRVSENAITQAISDLRQCLGDDPSDPTLIETVARRGYRLIAPVIRLAAPPERDGDAYGGDAADAPTRTEGNGERIAVLDFIHSPAEPDMGWLPTALARTLTGGLRTLPGFRIVDRQHVADAVSASGTSPEAVARHVQADFVVVGNVQRNRSRIRLSGRLISIASAEALVEARVEGTIDELFTLLDQMVTVFAHGLGIRRPKGSPSRIGARETQNLDAYRAAAEGWRQLDMRRIETLPPAAASFERALAFDADYAMAHAGMARARLAWFEASRADNQPAVDALEAAVEHARMATSRDEALAEAHATLGVALAGRGDWHEALVEAQRAIALESGNWRHHVQFGQVSWGNARLEAAERAVSLNPACARAFFQRATVLTARGDVRTAAHVLDEGLAQIRRESSDRAQVPGLGWLLGLIELASGHSAAATAAFERELALIDTNRPFGREYAMQAHLGYGLVLLTSRRAFDALSEFGAALALYPEHGASNLATAAALVGLGDRARATRHMATADEAIRVLDQHRPLEGQFVRAQRLAVTGAPDAAIDVLHHLLDTAPPGSTGWTIPIDPLLGAIRARPGYRALLDALAKRAE